MTQVGYDSLLHEACVVWGFCGCIKEGNPLNVDLLIPPDGPVTADQFVEWLFLADNVNPKSDPARWKRHEAALREAFVRIMGAETVDAKLLRGGDALPPEDEPDVKFRGNLSDGG